MATYMVRARVTARIHANSQREAEEKFAEMLDGTHPVSEYDHFLTHKLDKRYNDFEAEKTEERRHAPTSRRSPDHAQRSIVSVG